MPSASNRSVRNKSRRTKSAPSRLKSKSILHIRPIINILKKTKKSNNSKKSYNSNNSMYNQGNSYNSNNSMYNQGNSYNPMHLKRKNEYNKY